MSDVNINRTETGIPWVSRQDRRQRKTVTYKSDGMLFKEEWETSVVQKVKTFKCHSHDAYIMGGDPDRPLGHQDVEHNIFVFPWYIDFSSLEGQEIPTAYNIEFSTDGTATATVNTRYIEGDWEVVKKHDPVSLKKEPR